MDYLFFLQNLRETSLNWLTPIFSIISEATINLGPLIAVVIYACVDKKWGTKLIFNLCNGDFLMNNIKVSACVYRPWIKDSRLYVAREIEETATGYSFPSGHSTAATTVFGTVAVWQKAKKWLVTVMCLLIVLTMFARNWLGAHTIQDVLCALLLGVITITITEYAQKWLEKDEKRDIWIMLGILVLCILSIIYISFKSYPMEYLTDGSLLVDPMDMAKDAWAAIGMLSAWAISWFMERRYIKMSIEGSVLERVFRGVVIVVTFFVCYKIIFKKVAILVGGTWGSFLRRFLSVIVVCMILPWLISIIQKRRSR